MELYNSSFMNSKRTFRTPFKVTSMCFSPQNDLIALGSKTGEVMMKRTTWKIIWKTNVGMVPAIGTELKSASSVDALHFSPDGRYIAAATDKGILHLLDVESGKIRYTVKVADSITKLHWTSTREKLSLPGLFESLVEDKNFTDSRLAERTVDFAQAKPDISREEIAFVFQRLDEDGTSFKHDEAQKEALEKSFITSASFRESLRHTVLLASVDDVKIAVLIAAVFPYMEIDMEKTVEQFEQQMIMFYDMHYSPAFGGVSFIATTYGPNLECKQRELKPPVIDTKKPGQGCHTLIFNVKIDLDASLWDAALRYIRLLYGFNIFTISLDTTKRNWASQMASLHARFDTKTKAVKIGDVLIDMLLSGSTDAAGEAFLERGLGMDGLQGIKDFVEKHLAEVSRLVRGQLHSSTRNMCFQRCEFASALGRSREHAAMMDDDDYLYADESPTLESNPWLDSLEDKINILDMKVRQLGIQCLTMMQELGHLSKWISLTKPFAKSMKVNTLMKIKQMDIRTILEYIVANFIPDAETAKNTSKRLFKVKELLAEQREKDKEANFDEIKYLEEMEAIAEEERKKLMDKYQLKFDFSKIRGDPLEEEEKRNENRKEGEEEDGLKIHSFLPESKEPTEERPIDLDRIGSFFEKELSGKALEVLPKCCEKFDEFLDKRGSRMNSEEIKKMGLLTALEDIAKALSSPQKIHLDKDGNSKKLQVQFVYSIASDPRHQGYRDVKISNVTPAKFTDHAFNEIAGMGRSVQVTVIEKNFMNSFVLVPTVDLSVQRQNETAHVDAMERLYEFETIEVETRPTEEEYQRMLENDKPAEAMEVDENVDQLRIEVEDPGAPQYNTLVEYERIFPLRHGELVVVGKFSSTRPGTGLMTRMMRTVSCYPHQHYQKRSTFAVQLPEDGKPEVPIERMIVHPTTQLTAFLHEEGSKITIGDLKPEEPVLETEKNKRGKRKNFREYQRRREKYREGMGQVNLNDIQYDVLVQEAMDNGRDPSSNEGEDYDDEDSDDDDY